MLRIRDFIEDVQEWAQRHAWGDELSEETLNECREEFFASHWDYLPMRLVLEPHFNELFSLEWQTCITSARLRIAFLEGPPKE